MNPQQKIAAMNKIFSTCMDLAAKKGRDYSGTVDGMKNFRTFGWKGIVVRLEDKMQRLIQFSKAQTMAVKDESVEDTLVDVINYAALCLIMHREENKKIEGPAPARAYYGLNGGAGIGSAFGTCSNKVADKVDLEKIKAAVNALKSDVPIKDEKSLRFENMLANIMLSADLYPFYRRNRYSF